jgi:hypothetical protein
MSVGKLMVQMMMLLNWQGTEGVVGSAAAAAAAAAAGCCL